MSGKWLLYYSPTSCNKRLEKHSEFFLLPLGYRILDVLQTSHKTYFWVYNSQFKRLHTGCTRQNKGCGVDRSQDRILVLLQNRDKKEYWVYCKQGTRHADAWKTRGSLDISGGHLPSAPLDGGTFGQI